MNKLIAVAAVAVFTLSFAFAQSPAPTLGTKTQTPANADSSLPNKDEIDAAIKRTLGYDPNVSWEVLAILPSPISGIPEVIVSINKQPATYMYLSPDRKNAIIGEMIPFGVDPFAPARAKLQAADGPAQGPQVPAISIVEFSDLECPHCKAAQPIVEKLAVEFPQVRYVFQQFPLPATMHPWALKAAEYSDCAARTKTNDAFWKYTDSIFAAQDNISVATADDKLKELATAASLDAQKIAACAATPETEARVNKSLDLGRSLDVNQTPTVFINGRRVLGIASIPYDQLKNIVQFEIDHAGK